MKKLFILLVVGLILGLTSCNSENYCFAFNLDDSEELVIETLDKKFISNYRYEDNGNVDFKVIRIKRATFNGVKCNTSRIFIIKDKVCFMEYSVHDRDNIDTLMQYLTTNYGDPNTKNLNVQEGFAKYYWGDNDSKFMIIEDCDSFIKLYIGDFSEQNEITEYYKRKIFEE